MSGRVDSQYSQSLNPQYREFIMQWDTITGGSARVLNRTALTIALSSMPGLPIPVTVLVEIIMGGGEQFNTNVWYPITRGFMDKHIQPLFESQSNPVAAVADIAGGVFRSWFGF
jgi:hypothetical protein